MLKETWKIIGSLTKYFFKILAENPFEKVRRN